MEDKRCYYCKYAYNNEHNYNSTQCTRYPRWIPIHNPYTHWCGEWKEKEPSNEVDDT